MFSAGCHSPNQPPPQAKSVYESLALNSPTPVGILNARATPPLGWKPDPLKQSSSHTHEVWLSPDGRTAYGIIYFHLPLPVGHDLALWGFMNQMKQTEGEATLLRKQWDEQRNCVRFVAEGGLYKIRANLFVDGLIGWAVYAGTLRAQPVNEADLAIAENAREKTIVGGVSSTTTAPNMIGPVVPDDQPAITARPATSTRPATTAAVGE